ERFPPLQAGSRKSGPAFCFADKRERHWFACSPVPAVCSEAEQSPVEYSWIRNRSFASNCAGRVCRGVVRMVTFSDRAGAPAHVLVRLLDQECVLLNLETEQYFGLDETGTRMWQLVTTSPNIDAAYQELLAEYDVQPETLRENLTELLGHLVEHGLLQVLPADAQKPVAV